MGLSAGNPREIPDRRDVLREGDPTGPKERSQDLSGPRQGATQLRSVHESAPDHREVLGIGLDSPTLPRRSDIPNELYISRTRKITHRDFTYCSVSVSLYPSIAFVLRSNLFAREAHAAADAVLHRRVRAQFGARSSGLPKVSDHVPAARDTAG